MPLTSRELKERARQAMVGLSPSPVLVTLVYLLLTVVLVTAVNTLLPNVSPYDRGAMPMITLFLTILLTIYRTVMGFGYNCWALQAARGDQPGLWTLLDGFGMVGRVIWMEVRIFITILGWTFLLSFGFSFAVMASMLISEWLAVPMFLLLLASLFSVALRYELSPFLLVDYPADGAGTAIRRSASMMHGNLWRLVKLYLSFWPWYLAQALLELAAGVLPLLPTLNVLINTLQTGDMVSAVDIVVMASSSLLSTALLLVVQLIIEPRFFPYRRIAVAQFYRDLSGEFGMAGHSEANF